jgi:peptidoglycan/LPS O-acetylase OafA/YrhL
LLERSLTVDVLKVVAAQLIVWHHFSAYGPMADTMTLAWPQLMEWLYRYARLAVQVFLVVGGYLAAQSVMSKPITHPLVHIIKRYLRLVPFYVLALALISVAVAVSRDTIHASWLPSEPTVWQFVAHGLLMHDLLGVEALSSGAWYVAIDFQLYALLVVLCHVLHSAHQQRLSLVVALLCIASMWQFNRVDELDIWAIYFFGAYGLGVLAAWAKRSAFEAKVFWLTALFAVGALWLEYRTRLSLALLTAVWLVIKPKAMVHWTPVKRVVHRLSNSAYVLFLTHFGVIVITSALWHLCQLSQPRTAWAVMGLAWLCSVGLGLVLHEKLEVPLHHWISQKFKPFFLRWARCA